MYPRLPDDILAVEQVSERLQVAREGGTQVSFEPARPKRRSLRWHSHGTTRAFYCICTLVYVLFIFTHAGIVMGCLPYHYKVCMYENDCLPQVLAAARPLRNTIESLILATLDFDHLVRGQVYQPYHTIPYIHSSYIHQFLHSCANILTRQLRQ